MLVQMGNMAYSQYYPQVLKRILSILLSENLQNSLFPKSLPTKTYSAFLTHFKSLSIYDI